MVATNSVGQDHDAEIMVDKIQMDEVDEACRADEGRKKLVGNVYCRHKKKRTTSFESPGIIRLR